MIARYITAYYIDHNLTQWAKSPKKQSAGVHFDNIALYLSVELTKTRSAPPD